MHVCAHVRKCVFVPVFTQGRCCGGQKLTLGALLFYPPPWLLGRGLLLNFDLALSIRLPASRRCGTTCLCLPGLGLQARATPRFSTGAGDLNVGSSPLACSCRTGEEKRLLIANSNSKRESQVPTLAPPVAPPHQPHPPLLSTSGAQIGLKMAPPLIITPAWPLLGILQQLASLWTQPRCLPEVRC